MFSGIIEEIGRVSAAVLKPGLLTLTIECDACMEGLRIGDSLSVNGVCLTVCSFTGDSFTVEVIPETLSKSNLGALLPGSNVNLERSLTLETRIGGHFVQGHTDGTSEVLTIAPEGESLKMWFAIPQAWAGYFIPKGFVAIDGMSLTLVDVSDETFSICFIPHTQNQTIVQYYRVGTCVNIEIDHLTKTVVHIVNQRMSHGYR
jgi:riboflavin synthase